MVRLVRLGIFADRYVYRVAWWDAEDGEGAGVGQEHSRGSPSDAEIEKAKKNRTKDGYEHYEYLLVERAARAWYTAQVAKGADVSLGTCAYEMGTRNLASELLAVARAAVKQAKSEWTKDRPWPEWAKTASAHGWKPPKGWQP